MMFCSVHRCPLLDSSSSYCLNILVSGTCGSIFLFCDISQSVDDIKKTFKRRIVCLSQLHPIMPKSAHVFIGDPKVGPPHPHLRRANEIPIVTIRLHGHTPVIEIPLSTSYLIMFLRKRVVKYTLYMYNL